jgi:hypothetical protein
MKKSQLRQIVHEEIQKILTEGYVSLTPEEKQKIEELIPQIIDIIQGPIISPDGGLESLGWMDYETANGKKDKVLIRVQNNDPSAKGTFNRYSWGSANITIQQRPFLKYFNKIDNIRGKLTGDKNKGIEILRGVLTHELIHAKDPTVDTDSLMGKKALSSEEEKYYNSWTEFKAMSGAFFEGIKKSTKRALSSDSSKQNIEKIKRCLADILNFYAAFTNTIRQETIDFIQDTGERNSFQSLIKYTENFITNLGKSGNVKDVRKGKRSALETYMEYIEGIRIYNPDGYKRFQRELYKVIDELNNRLNSIKQ